MKKNLNVMLSLMQLDIGGAETHVVELAKELKRRGFNPIVTSNGGAYVKELEISGIKHYKVPLQNKNPINMIKSIRLLKRIIIDEKIDVVHSHARIPSFILARLHRRMKFPFVTTAHWVFTTKYGLKYITEWGEKTVAVSEDIKKYLMDNYKIPESDIRVTINGIDTDKFSPDTDVSDVRKELGTDENDTVIVYISRMDTSRSLAAKHLLKVVPDIAAEQKNLKVVVVGGGDDYDNVAAMAANVNARLGYKCVIMTGARTDINKLAGLADLFVGVSRAALEAMAAEKPVIIAGNEGYIGLFDETKLDVGIDTNFCCRGCEQSSPERILSDVRKFFSMPPEERRHLAHYGRELVKRDYSVARMADDTVRVYEWALSKQTPILVSGYYGFRNSGDDALLAAITNDLRKNTQSPNLVVLSANPNETMTHYRVKAVNRLNLIKINKYMKEGGLLISGGGTLIQDATSTKSLWYYVAIIRLALKNKMRVMMYANGIGPLRGANGAKLARDTLNRVDLITLRDPEALRSLNKIGVREPRTIVTADPVFGMDIADAKHGLNEVKKFADIGTSAGFFVISVRRVRGCGNDFEHELAKMCDYIAEKYNLYPVFVPMQIAKDEAVSRAIMSKMKNSSAIIDTRLDVYNMMSIIAAANLCVGMRLHSLIYAASACVPLIALSYDPKIKSFMDYAGQTMCADAAGFTAEEGIALADKCFKDYDRIKSELNKSRGILKDKANENGILAAELYEKGSVNLEK